VDHARLRKGVHQVRRRHSKLGKVEEALPWFKRAAKAKEKGDICGRLDEESLQHSSEAFRACLEKLGRP